jgi:hypothetical protein
MPNLAGVRHPKMNLLADELIASIRVPQILWGNTIMNKLALAAAVTGVLGALSVVATAADAPRGHHHHYVRGPTVAAGNPAVTDGYVMNGAFDWRHRRYGWNPPWYAYGYNPNCLAWTPHAYHYACDPNSRY